MKNFNSFLSTFNFKNTQNMNLIIDIEKQKNNISLQLSNDRIKAIQTYRAHFSNSLLSSKKDLLAWNKAQYLLHDYLQKKQNINLEDVINMNQIITSNNSKGIRDKPIYTAAGEHTKAKYLPILINNLFSYLNKITNCHNIYKAFICRYFLLSIHPFIQGNGRTSQLVADFYLLQDNFLPQTFFSKTEIIMACTNKKQIAPQEAFDKFIQTIQNSYKIACYY